MANAGLRTAEDTSAQDIRHLLPLSLQAAVVPGVSIVLIGQLRKRTENTRNTERLGLLGLRHRYLATMVIGTCAQVAIGVVIAALFWLYRVNKAMKSTPWEAQQVAAPRWAPDELRAAYERVEENPIDFTPHLPPKLPRRYIVVGGSGQQVYIYSGARTDTKRSSSRSRRWRHRSAAAAARALAREHSHCRFPAAAAASRHAPSGVRPLRLR